jgi:hypothetical protein
MALNLGETLREAVDGPALDELVGEDPADVDLPALSARIRRRRRARATTRSAVGVAAAGAVALVGVHGLDRRGVEPAGTFSELTQARQRLCGLDVTRVPRVAGPQLVRAGEPVVVDAAGGGAVDGAVSTLGTLVGRTLTAIAAVPAGAGSGDVTLTTNGTVVAVGTLRAGAVILAGSGSGSTVSAVSSDLAPCPTSAGTPARVPAGTYSVQYLWERTGSSGGLVRSSAGSWTVTLLDESPSVTLPAGFPSDEVPVVGGTLVSVTSNTSSDDGSTTTWTVKVAVEGDDGVTRAAAALRAAGATVTDTLGFVTSTPDGGAPEASSGGGAQPSGAMSEAVLATLQARRAAALEAVAAAQATYDSLVAARAATDALQWAARTLQAARTEVTGLDGQIAEALRASAPATPTAPADQAQQAQQAQPDQAPAAGATYTLAGTDGLTATTRSWAVRVDAGTTDDRTVLTYTLTRG